MHFVYSFVRSARSGRVLRSARTSTRVPSSSRLALVIVSLLIAGGFPCGDELAVISLALSSAKSISCFGAWASHRPGIENGAEQYCQDDESQTWAYCAGKERHQP